MKHITLLFLAIAGLLKASYSDGKIVEEPNLLKNISALKDIDETNTSLEDVKGFLRMVKLFHDSIPSVVDYDDEASVNLVLQLSKVYSKLTYVYTKNEKLQNQDSSEMFSKVSRLYYNFIDRSRIEDFIPHSLAINVPSPVGGSGVSAGAHPESLEDVATRRKYLELIEDQRLKSNMNKIQAHLSREKQILEFTFVNSNIISDKN